MTASEDTIRLHVRLHLAQGVGSVIYRRLIEHFGDVAAVFEAGPAGVCAVEGVGSRTAEAIFAVDDDAACAEIAAAEAVGARIIPFGDDAYPVALANILDPPAVVYLRGSLEPSDTAALAVVGSRRCTHYGAEQAERFGGLLGRVGLTVVSGGARGIDTAAHRGALNAGGRTIVVTGCGLDRVYPQENRPLFDRIIDEGRGAILSTLPMGTEVTPANFPRRNRIISGLSQGVLVVEAARRSGSLITARFAGEQGRQVYALPGRVDSPFSEGTHELIRDGAVLVRNLDDILEHLDGLGEVLGENAPAETPPVVRVELDGLEAAIAAALGDEALSIDHVAAAVDRPAHEVIAAMTTLTIKGVVASRPGNVFVLKRRPQGGRHEA
ncbi:MAG: DNA-protecting protein DprA [Planctomycetes bacterium]|nr:DNA-protecting protein DprA [Planctomycetota bacterium]